MKNRVVKQLLSCIGIFAILAGLLPQGVYAAGKKEEIVEKEEIHIRNMREFLEFAEDCRSDIYSDNLVVSLEADLNLSNEAFSPISTFNGIFNGNGHTISGMKTSKNGSNMGLFRYVRSEGQVSDLVVTGEFAPGGSKSQLGGIAGTNYGVISNCSFSGNISGLTSVGGIAGENYGTIKDCAASGAVNGKRYTGGIAGKNEGLISNCTSSVEVNCVITESQLEISSLTLAKLTSANDKDVVSDSGGIAGLSSGIIINCHNSGQVGYSRYGYNSGGIAGCQSGYINECTNEGAVLGKKDVGGIVGQMEPNLETLKQRTIADEINTLNALLDGALYNLRGNFAVLAEIMGNTNVDTGDTDIQVDEESGQISGIDTSAITNSLLGISNTLAGSGEGLSNAVAQASTDFAAANAQFSVVMNMLTEALSGNFSIVEYDDVSDEDKETDTDGKVSNCYNTGNVEGDTNVGGIAGAMGVEYDNDLDGLLTSGLGTKTIMAKLYRSRCVSRDNSNKGSVKSVKNCSGGVAGLMEFGSMISCTNYGNICADGSYAGGLSGYSYAPVRECWTMCSVEADEYAGGIVGYGTVIKNNVALPGIDENISCAGAIAGNVDFSSEDTIVENNVFVSTALGGIDGINYNLKAFPVEYTEITEKENIPEGFGDVTVIFKADDKVVKEISMKYGDSIPPKSIPKVPDKSGYKGEWEEFDADNIIGNMEIRAIYTTRHSTIASQEKGSGSPQSLVLAEGNFDDTSRIRVEAYNGTVPVSDELKFIESNTIYVSSDFDNSENSYTIRYYTPEISSSKSHVEFYALNEDETWTVLNTSVSGKYTSFPMKGGSITVAAFETEGIQINRYYIYFGVGTIAALIAVSVILTIKRKKK